MKRVKLKVLHPARKLGWFKFTNETDAPNIYNNCITTKPLKLETGFNVINLGVCIPQVELLNNLGLDMYLFKQADRSREFNFNNVGKLREIIESCKLVTKQGTTYLYIKVADSTHVQYLTFYPGDELFSFKSPRLYWSEDLGLEHLAYKPITQLLAVNHPYYAGAEETWDNMTDFLDEYEKADLDYNLCIRWDVRESSVGKHGGTVVIFHQRKDYTIGHEIKTITEKEMVRFRSYIEKHWNHLNLMWEPISHLSF